MPANKYTGKRICRQISIQEKAKKKIGLIGQIVIESHSFLEY